MFYYLSLGVTLGMVAGFSPGPLLTLVISETLEHGVGSGIKVALAPIITDLPIVVISLLLFSQLSGFENILGIISLLGGCYVLYMAYETMSLDGQNNTSTNSKPKSFKKGIITNLLSPHPYLFWLSVGAPTITKSLAINNLAAILFVGSFYIFLVGAKVLLALITGKTKSFMHEKAYLYTMRFLGVMLCLFAIALFVDGLRLLDIIV